LIFVDVLFLLWWWWWCFSFLIFWVFFLSHLEQQEQQNLELLWSLNFICFAPGSKLAFFLSRK
jgi:hypothetical protein